MKLSTIITRFISLLLVLVMLVGSPLLTYAQVVDRGGSEDTGESGSSEGDSGASGHIEITPPPVPDVDPADSEQESNTKSGSRHDKDKKDTIDDKPKEDTEPIDGEETPMDIESNPANPIASDNPGQTVIKPEVDQSTGALVYNYPFELPLGRNDMTPNVALTYNSLETTNDSIVGSGWSVNIPYIKRLNKTGTNNLYSDNYFYSSLDGELVPTGNGDYAAKVEKGDLRKYTLTSGVWTVTDKNGTIYKLGTTTSSRQDDPSDSTRIFKWMLEETRDTNDNYISYTYYKDAGQIYPLKITYSGNGNTPGIYTVNFDRSSNNAPVLFSSGFSVQSNYHITEIRIEVNSVWARKYILAYTAGDSGAGSLLDTILESGQDDLGTVVTLPIADFDYQTSTPSWTRDSTWSTNFTSPIPPFADTNGVDTGMRMADINGDGLLDSLCHNNQNTGADCARNQPKVFLNNGDGTWTDVSATWLFPLIGGAGSTREYFLSTYGGEDRGLRLLDINADGLSDLLSEGNVYLNNTAIQSNLLSKITSTQGGSTQIMYKTSPQYRNVLGVLNPSLPHVMDLVDQVVTSDVSSGVVESLSYEYEGGKYYYSSYLERKLSGFNSVKVTDAAGNVKQTFYHQGDSTNASLGEYDDTFSKIGLSYRTDVLDSAGTLKSMSVIKYEEAPLVSLVPNTRYFVYPVQTISTLDPNGANAFSTATTNSYDTSTGNLLSTIQWGKVNATTPLVYTDLDTDKRTIEYTYSTNNTTGVTKPSSTKLSDINNVKVTETLFAYDGGTLTKGNLTSKSNWQTGSVYDTSLTSYNQYGLVTSETNPRNYVTSYVYDVFNLFPITITQPLSLSRSYTYDYKTGKPLTLVDENLKSFSYTYDGFGRLLSETIPSDVLNNTNYIKNQYQYNDTPNAQNNVYLHITSGNSIAGANSSPTTHSYKLFDGLGRLVREITQRASTTYVATDTNYNQVGQVASTSLPYAYTGSLTFKTPTTPAQSLFTNFTYDSLGRNITASDALGTTTTSYAGNTKTITDPELNQKVLSYDGQNRLALVTEVLSPNNYVTSYQWTAHDKLSKITDALGNIRNFTYNGEGWQLTAQDIHGPNDATFGTHTYVYDKRGNVMQHITPNAINIQYTYDQLDRVKTEKLSSDASARITYSYDSCLNGKTRLCSVAYVNGPNYSYTYSNNGNLASESVLIPGTTNQTTSYNYDVLGNQKEIIYPDTSKTTYSYTQRNLPNAINYVVGGVTSPVVVSTGYNELGQPLIINYGNGRVSTLIYNALAKYRLTTLRTNAPSGYYQNTALLYTPVGNISKVTETGTAGFARVVNYAYDPLYRLTSAIATSGGTPLYNQTFSYNAIGNILDKSDQGTYGYQTPGKTNPHAVTLITPVSGPTTSLVYDNNGNLTTYGTKTLGYNYRNEMTSLVDGANSYSYLYNHDGARVKYTMPATSTYYPNESLEIDGTSGKITKNINLGDKPIATIETSAGTSTRYYIHRDFLGGTALVTNQSGTPVQVLDYFPYGSPRLNTQTGSFDESQKYTGHVYDDETELSYMKARYQSGKLGKFTEQDPVFWAVGNDQVLKQKTGGSVEKYLSDPQGFNSYSYARNNPMNLVDESGEWFKEYLTGNQSRSDFQQEIGEAANNMGSGWQTVMDHPVAAGAAVGVASGAAAYAVAGGVTSLSLTVAAGWGTQVMGNLNKLDKLPQANHAVEGLSNLSSKTGQPATQILNEAIKNGKTYVDYLPRNTGNINIYSPLSEGYLTRITTNPQITKVISVGRAEVSQLVNNLASGRQVPLSQSRGLSGLVNGIISTAKK